MTERAAQIADDNLSVGYYLHAVSERAGSETALLRRRLY
jgi:hypothetical protein